MSLCLKCESVCALEERNFSVKFPDLDIVVDLAAPGSLDRLLIGLGVNVKAADNVTVIVGVICVVRRHASSLREPFLIPRYGCRRGLERRCRGATVGCARLQSGASL
jgi:hypothetical protein